MVTGDILVTLPKASPTTSHPPTQEVFCSLQWRTWDNKNPTTSLSELAQMEALNLGAAAWEDSGSFTWPVVVTRTQQVAGRVSIEVDAHLPGSQPHTAHLLVILPLWQYDLDHDPGIGAAKGVQWWIPGTSPKLKLVNRRTSPKNIAGGVEVATAYANNCDDVERMLLLKEPSPAAATPLPPSTPEPTAAGPDPGVRVSEANTGQLNSEYRQRLLRILSEYNDKSLFPADK